MTGNFSDLLKKEIWVEGFCKDICLKKLSQKWKVSTTEQCKISNKDYPHTQITHRQLRRILTDWWESFILN